jgi:hypothetical protein
MPHKGFKHSAETIAKMSEAHFRLPKRTEESKARIRGPKNPNWRGGRPWCSSGYILILSPDHPHQNCRGYVLEHRLVMEAHLGRTLLPTEVVHHINGIVDDNRIENLQRFDSQADHLGWHLENQE